MTLTYRRDGLTITVTPDEDGWISLPAEAVDRYLEDAGWELTNGTVPDALMYGEEQENA